MGRIVLTDIEQLCFRLHHNYFKRFPGHRMLKLSGFLQLHLKTTRLPARVWSAMPFLLQLIYYLPQTHIVQNKYLLFYWAIHRWHCFPQLRWCSNDLISPLRLSYLFIVSTPFYMLDSKTSYLMLVNALQYLHFTWKRVFLLCEWMVFIDFHGVGILLGYTDCSFDM